jgi:hypothetical protein
MNTPTNSEALPLTNCSAWIPSSEITNRPDLHSTALETVKLLIAVRDIPTAQFGKYIASCDEWFMDGSPSRWEITHFAVIPSLPNTKLANG